MISYLSGKIVDLDFNTLTILTASGVGYELHINELTYSKLALHDDASLFVYHHITENSESIFGFIEKDEKLVFTELIKISGVGGKVAMQILSLGITKLIDAVAHEDNKTIESIKGIGKKMAEKIILELRDKDFGISLSRENSPSQLNRATFSSIKETLVNMGYNPAKVDEELSQIPESMTEAGDIIPEVIKNIG